MFTFNELAGRQPADVKKTAGTITGRFSIKKADEDKHLAFGWAYVSQDEEGQQTEDWSGDQLEPSELEQAAYGFVELYREGGEMHERAAAPSWWRVWSSPQRNRPPLESRRALSPSAGGSALRSPTRMCGPR